MEHWNKIQQQVAMNPSTRRLVSKEGREEFNQQELLIRQQAEHLDKQQKQIIEQQRRIQQQAEQIRILVHQQKILIRECKASGIKIPLSTPSPLTTAPLAVSATPLASTATTPTNSKPQSQVSIKSELPKKEQSSSQCKINVATTSSTNNLLPHPPAPLPPPQPHPLIYQHSLPPPPHPSSLSVEPPVSSLPKMQHNSQVTYPMTPPTIPYVPPPTSLLPDNYPIPPMPSRSPDYIGPPYGPPSQGLLAMTTSDPSLQYLGPPPDFFSPLTSKELMELTSQEVHKLNPYAPQSLGSFVPPLQEDLDNIFNLPTGCGAGYGVGIPDDELHVSIPDSMEV